MCSHTNSSPLQPPCCAVFQDGQDVTPSERIAARQALPSLKKQLAAELSAEGVDVQAAAGVEDDGDLQEEGEVAETGYVDEQGELRRPWCPQTRILEHREMVSSAAGRAHSSPARVAARMFSVSAGRSLCSHKWPIPMCIDRVQEKANQEAAAAKAAASEDPLAPAPAPQRHEVRLANGSSTKPPSMLLAAACAAKARLELLSIWCLRQCVCAWVCLSQDFPALPADSQVMQRNEGRWDFTLQESDDGCVQRAAACPVVYDDGGGGGCLRLAAATEPAHCLPSVLAPACRQDLVLEVAVGKFLDTSLIKADVQPRAVRLLIKGRLLQLVLPAEVCGDMLLHGCCAAQQVGGQQAEGCGA